jgi:serine/threonine protein kinase/Tfp pilus assembly protein PilF
MPAESKAIPEREQLLDEVVTAYLREVTAGQTPDRKELLARHPVLAAELAEFFADQDDVQRWATPLRIVAAIQAEGTLGDFRIVREIGRGGMGVVYEAVQISLGRRVALKVLPFAAALDSKQLQRFKNEAQAAAGLQHTNIVPVYFVGCERGVHFYAMQFVEGQTLAALIQELRQSEGRNGDAPSEPRPLGSGSAEPLGQQARQGTPAYPPRPPEGLASELTSGRWAPAREGNVDSPATGPYVPSAPVDQTPQAATVTPPVGALSTEHSTRRPAFFRTVANLGIQAAEALEHAHQLGVIHRDIKPANLMVDARGNLWITDFGLAHCQGAVELTMSGDLLGTLRYMSPEQALAQRVLVDQRTDIYSLGVTLYELLTLEPVFPGRDRQELLRQIAFEEPKPPRRLNKAIPVEMETILLKAIAKNPDERYATAQEVADDLRRYLEDKPINAKRPNAWQRLRKWRRRHKTLVTAASVVLFILLVAAAASSLVMWRAYKAETKAYEAEAQRRRRTQGSLKFAFHVLGGIYDQVMHIQPMADPEAKKEQDALLKRTLEFYQKFAEENADDPTVRMEVARAYANMAGMYRTLGDFEPAKQAFNQAFAHAEQAAAELPNDPILQADLAAAYFSLAVLQADEGNLAKAVELDERAIDILSRLPPEAFRAEARCRFWLASAYKSLASHLIEQGGRWAKAVESYNRAIEVEEKLVRDFPGDATYLKLLGNCHMEMGNALRGGAGGASDREGAKKSYERAIEIQARLAKDFPDGYSRSDLIGGSFIHHAVFQSDLALSHHNLANLLRERNEELAEAQQHYRQAVKLWTEADKRQPNRAEYKWWLGMAHNNLGSLLKEQGQREEASQHIDQAVRLLAAVFKNSPKAFRYRDELASSYFNLGAVREDDDRIEEAEQAYRNAFTTCRDLARDCPQAQLWALPAKSAFALAHILMQTGRSLEAKDICHQALAQALAADDVEFRNELAWQLSTCPDLELRDPARALKLARENVKTAPLKGDYWNTLGATQCRAENWTAALEAFGHSMQLKNGGDSSDWFFMAMAHWRRGEKEEAHKRFNQAVIWMDKYGPLDNELRRFRSEAADLLQVKDQLRQEKGKP